MMSRRINALLSRNSDSLKVTSRVQPFLLAFRLSRGDSETSIRYKRHIRRTCIPSGHKQSQVNRASILPFVNLFMEVLKKNLTAAEMEHLRSRRY